MQCHQTIKSKRFPINTLPYLKKGSFHERSPLQYIEAVFFLIAALLFLPIFKPSLATAESGNVSTTYFTPILAVWRDQNAFLVLGTGHGNFYYTYGEQVKAVDGQTTYRQQDNQKALLKAILSHNDGTPILLHVSTLAKDVLVGINQVTAPLQQTTETRSMVPNQ